MPNWIDFLTPLISLIALILSLLSFIKNQNMKSDDVLMESCRSLLDHAYQILIKGKQEDNFPVADRVQWLTAARAIVQFYKVRDEIKTRPYRNLVEKFNQHIGLNLEKFLILIRLGGGCISMSVMVKR